MRLEVELQVETHGVHLLEVVVLPLFFWFEFHHLECVSATSDVLIDDLDVPTDVHDRLLEEPPDGISYHFNVDCVVPVHKVLEEFLPKSFSPQSFVLLIGDGNLLEDGGGELAICLPADGEADDLALESGGGAVLLDVRRLQLGVQVLREVFQEDEFDLVLDGVTHLIPLLAYQQWLHLDLVVHLDVVAIPWHDLSLSFEDLNEGVVLLPVLQLVVKEEMCVQVLMEGD